MDMSREDLITCLKDIVNLLETPISTSEKISPKDEKSIYDKGFSDGVASIKSSAPLDSIKKMSEDMSKMSHEIESYKSQLESLKKVNLELSKKVRENKEYSSLLSDFCDVLTYASRVYPGIPCMFCANRVGRNRCKAEKCSGYDRWRYKPLSE